MLTELDDTELEKEIVESKERLEKKLGKEVVSFCYPNGDYNQKILQKVDKAGYKYAVTTEWGNNEKDRPRLALRRFDMVVKNMLDSAMRLSEARLAWRISGLYPGFRFK